jgi:hypothetical protein
MKRIVFGSAVVVAWCVAVPLAQQQPAPTPKATPAHNVFVLTGCLSAGTDPASTFKLTDASSIGPAAPGGKAEARAVGTSGQGTSGQGTSGQGTSADKVSYELRPVSGLTAQGLDAEELKAHVGQRVEVVVRPIEAAAAAPSPATTSGPVEAAKPIEPAPERYTVTELKRVVGRCS